MILRPAVLLLALTASTLAWGETLDPPERVARLSYVEGQVAFQGAQESMSSALPDRPLMPGDRLVTERGGRAEVTLGTAALRLDEHTDLTLVGLDATTVWVELNRGTASVYLRELLEDEMFEIVTPNTAIALHEPGEYRVEVSADGATSLTVRGGDAEVDTAGGPVRVADGQRVLLARREGSASLASPQPEDAFDGWVLSREQQLADAESRYALRDGEEYEELDRYGEWYDEPSYGRVWMPSYAYGGGSPFHYGHWTRVGFGWTWFDPLPWSAFTFHHGRWAFLHHLNRWCWVPSSRFHRRHFDHERRFVHDTRPFGHPRSDVRPRDDRRDRPRDADPRRDDDEHRPVTTVDGGPRRIDADRRSVFRPDVESMKRSQATTAVRSLDDRTRTSTWRSSSPSRSSVTTMRPSSGSTTTTRAPSRSSSSGSSRSSSSSRDASSSQRNERSSTSSRSTKSTFAVRPP